ncbi:bZIP transcription factor [Flectobacillus major]|uniref:bZIP transcription factor n=1 Tax=Flectobacillus major TaxID=103 RepID=UPI0003FC2EEE|nr:bZIP transcription factor [Flectobacillus major]
MKIRLLLSASLLIGCAMNLSAQTITAPTGQSLIIANPVNITGGSVNIKADSAYKIGGKTILSIKGFQNIFLGDSSGVINSGTNNTFVGKNAGAKNTSGASNMFLGSFAGYRNISGAANTFIGVSAGEGNTTGGNNLFMGTAAGAANGGGNLNTFIGVNAGRFNQNADGNAFIGLSAGYNNTSGYYNTSIGTYAGQGNTSGFFNTFIGAGSGNNITTGSSNIFIGFQAGTTAGTGNITNAVAIGSNAVVGVSNAIVLGNNASVGIGTSDPITNGAKLVVVGAGSGANVLQLRNLPNKTVTTGLKQLFADASGNIVTFSSTTSQSTNAVSEGTSVISSDNWLLTKNGFLKNNNPKGIIIGEGIESLPSGYNLYVTEGVLTEKVKVALKNSDEWADYVFDKKYNRMTLSQVEKYIQQNKHLPNVPSAAEMVENGNDLHKTDIKLLEKIEELTLYMIELKKENQQMKKAIKALTKRKR